jgi:hypothetical protein
MPNYLLNRNFALATTKGHIIHFKKGQPTWVPPVCVPDAVAIGAVPADGSDADVIKEIDIQKAPSDPSTREKLLLELFEKLIAANQREDFTAAGAPHVKAIERELKFKVDNRERDVVWQKYRDAQAVKTAEAA